MSERCFSAIFLVLEKSHHFSKIAEGDSIILSREDEERVAPDNHFTMPLPRALDTLNSPKTFITELALISVAVKK